MPTKFQLDNLTEFKLNRTIQCFLDETEGPYIIDTYGRTYHSNSVGWGWTGEIGGLFKKNLRGHIKPLKEKYNNGEYVLLKIIDFSGVYKCIDHLTV